MHTVKPDKPMTNEKTHVYVNNEANGRQNYKNGNVINIRADYNFRNAPLSAIVDVTPRTYTVLAWPVQQKISHFLRCQNM